VGAAGQLLMLSNFIRNCCAKYACLTYMPEANTVGGRVSPSP
jgi:hypothetical protein